MKNRVTISLLTLAAILIAVWLLFKDILSKITFNVGMEGATTGIKSLADLQSFLQGSGAVTFNFLIDVTNASWLTIKLRDLETRVFYKGQLIGNSGLAALKNIDINAGSFKKWVEPVDIRVSKTVLSALMSDLISGKDPELSYETEMRIYGIRYTYSDRVKIIETTLSSL